LYGADGHLRQPAVVVPGARKKHPPYYFYILRSLVKRNMFSPQRRRYRRYVYGGICAHHGPPKRLRQHNGILVGGAKDTSFDRPWLIMCYVTCSAGLVDHTEICRLEKKFHLVQRRNQKAAIPVSSTAEKMKKKTSSVRKYTYNPGSSSYTQPHPENKTTPLPFYMFKDHAGQDLTEFSKAFYNLLWILRKSFQHS
jgi:hypothetical protein